MVGVDGLGVRQNGFQRGGDDSELESAGFGQLFGVRIFEDVSCRMAYLPGLIPPAHGIADEFHGIHVMAVRERGNGFHFLHAPPRVIEVAVRLVSRTSRGMTTRTSRLFGFGCVCVGFHKVYSCAGASPLVFWKENENNPSPCHRRGLPSR